MTQQQPALREWMKGIPESEFQRYQKTGHRRRLTFGKNPALAVIDVTIGFVGSKPQPFEEAVKEYSSSCGNAFWDQLPQYQRLLELFREKNYPVFYTREDVYNQNFGGFATKAFRPEIDRNDPKYNQIPDAVAQREGEWILNKPKASMFFNTSLNVYLTKLKVDTLVVCGGSTSGCLRASVVDAFSNGYTPFIVEDACFDRSYFAHCASLFDMDAKYASVIPLSEVETELATISAIKE